VSGHVVLGWRPGTSLKANIETLCIASIHQRWMSGKILAVGHLRGTPRTIAAEEAERRCRHNLLNDNPASG